MTLLKSLCGYTVALLWLGGCSALAPAPAKPPTFYTLDATASVVPPQIPPWAAAPSLVVDVPRAAAGFDSVHIVYSRSPHTLEHFAFSEWVDTPARMLATRIVATLGHSGTFSAVVPAPSAVVGGLRLDTEIKRLLQDFASSPSQVRFTLRATLVDTATRKVIAWREFDTRVPAATDNPYGGVVAANQAVDTVLAELSAFCAVAVKP